MKRKPSPNPTHSCNRYGMAQAVNPALLIRWLATLIICCVCIFKTQEADTFQATIMTLFSSLLCKPKK